MTSTSTPRLLQIAVARVETKLTENGVQAFRYALWRKVYRKLVEQDMSYFEMKFTKPREANRLLMSQTGQFQRIISQVLRMVGEVSRLVTSAVYLLQSNRPLFLVMLVTTPATLLANEGFDRLSHYLQIQMIETEQYEFNELISTLESRAGFISPGR